jgi:hypothetical protein
MSSAVDQGLDLLQQKLSQQLSDARALIGKYEEIIKSHIPETLRGAIEEGWEMEVSVLEMKALVGYSKNQQAIDRTRAITLKKCEEILADYDNSIDQAMVNALTSGPIGALWQTFTGIPKLLLIFSEAATATADAIVTLVRVYGVTAVLFNLKAIGVAALTFVTVFFFLIVRMFYNASTLKRLTAGILPLLKVRDQFAERLRKAALKQRKQKRKMRSAQTRARKDRTN